MAGHYIYNDNADGTNLNQGDVLQKTPEFVALLETIHPHYARHESYKYFLVLTQSCDLVRRSGEANARYISIAAVRPVQDAILREAKAYQQWWQEPLKVVDSKAFGKLQLFLESLLDNNQAAYFYLHEDVASGIFGKNCAFLALSIALRAEHYDLCLRAKIAQLQESFQAKLGWLVGNMYGRVGTSEWNEHYGQGAVGREASALLTATLIQLGFEQSRAGVRDLEKVKPLNEYAPSDIYNHILNTKLVPKDRQLWARLREVLEKFGIASRISTPLASHVRERGELVQRLESLLTQKGVPNPAELAKEIEKLALSHLSFALRANDCPVGPAIVEKLMGTLQPDTVIRNIINS